MEATDNIFTVLDWTVVRFGLDGCPFCPYCIEVVHSPSHVFFECPKFTSERGDLNRQIGSEVSVENITDIMLGSQANWGYVANYVKLVLIELRREDNPQTSVV